MGPCNATKKLINIHIASICFSTITKWHWAIQMQYIVFYVSVTWFQQSTENIFNQKGIGMCNNFPHTHIQTHTQMLCLSSPIGRFSTQSFCCCYWHCCRRRRCCLFCCWLEHLFISHSLDMSKRTLFSSVCWSSQLQSIHSAQLSNSTSRCCVFFFLVLSWLLNAIEKLCMFWARKINEKKN